MDQELKKELEWLNDNLKAVVENQTVIFCKLQEIEAEIKQETKA